MQEKPTSEQIDDIIRKNEGWKGDVVAKARALIKEADPQITEEIKWKMPSRPEGLAVWSHGGIVCYAEIWKDNVKLIFQKGAQVADPDNLFNARLKSSAVRAIEFREGDGVDGVAFKRLVQDAVQANISK